MTIKLKIKKPDDSRDYFNPVEISSENIHWYSKSFPLHSTHLIKILPIFIWFRWCLGYYQKSRFG